MKKRLYRKILKKLLKLFGKDLKGHRLKRVKKLAAMICGLLRKKQPSMKSLGHGLPQPIQSHSREKSAKAFVDNKWVDYQTFYLPFITSLLTTIFELYPHLKNDIKLVIDGSKIGKHHMTLMISLVFRGRGIPIVWLVRRKKKGHFDADTHIELVERAKKILTPFINDFGVVLLGDGEFGNLKLQKWCISNSWHYVFRIAKDNHLYDEDNHRFNPTDVQVNDNQQFVSFPNVDCTAERLKDVHFVLWHDEKYEEPLPLISNLEEPIDIIEAYDIRYSIECLFKDMKSNTFNLHKTRLKSEHAINNLIMIGAFAISLLFKLGVRYEKSSIRKYIHRIRPDRIVNSLITFAIQLIDFFLEEDLDFTFEFSPSP